jgi:uncharacterized protein (TIGR02466 family)
MNFEVPAARYDCFVTPIWRFPSDGSLDLGAIEAAIQAERAADPTGTEVSNVGGWQSNEKYLYKQEAFQPLVGYLQQRATMVFQEWGFDFMGHMPVVNTMWANINRGWNTNNLHHHWGFTLQNFNLLSGAFYVKCNQQSGAIKFVDERPSSKFVTEHSFPFVPSPTNFIGASFAVQPSPGEMVMFPAWIEHKVDPSQDDSERISMSFNLSLPEELEDWIHQAKREQEKQE